MGSGWTEPAYPWLVLVIERTMPLPDPLTTLQGYVGAWLLVTHEGRPVGEMEVGVPPEKLDADAVRTRLRAAGLWPPDRECGVESAPEINELPPASVVLPTLFARPHALAQAVESLLALDYPGVELIVVDSRPAHVRDPDDWARLPGTPRVVSADGPGISVARNAGVRAATGDLIAFTDDDVVVDRGWLRALAGRMVAEPAAGCVTGLVCPRRLDTAAQVWFERAGLGPSRCYTPASFRTGVTGTTGIAGAAGVAGPAGVAGAAGAAGPARAVVSVARRPWDRRRFVLSRRAGTESLSWLYQLGDVGTGANMAWRADVLADLGGFDPALGAGTPAKGGEDIEMFVRLLFAGRGLAMEPTAVVFHAHRGTESQLRDQAWGYGVGLTAMLASCVRRDPWHLYGLLRATIPGVRAVARGGPPVTCRPREIRRLTRWGQLWGPIAYLLSRHKMRRWTG